MPGKDGLLKDCLLVFLCFAILVARQTHVIVIVAIPKILSGPLPTSQCFNLISIIFPNAKIFSTVYQLALVQ